MNNSETNSTEEKPSLGLSDNSALLSCPFCGEAPHVTKKLEQYGPRFSCKNSKCRLGNIIGSFSEKDWNTRAR